MTDNIETMRGVIADALSNPAGTCATSCEANAYQIEIRRLIADRAKLEARLRNLTQGLASNGCEIVTDTEGVEWVRNIRAEKAEADLGKPDPVNARLLELAKWAASCLDFDEDWMPEAAEKLRRTRDAIAAAEAQRSEPVNARLLEVLKAAKVALQKVVDDCGGCEHEAGVCVCPELAAISQSGEAIAAAEAQQAAFANRFAIVPKRLTRAMNRVIEEEGWEREDLLAAAEAITEEEYSVLAGDESKQAGPVRLTDAWIEEVRDDGLFLQGVKQITREIEAATLRANGFKVEI